MASANVSHHSHGSSSRARVSAAASHGQPANTRFADHLHHHRWPQGASASRQNGAGPVDYRSAAQSSIGQCDRPSVSGSCGSTGRDDPAVILGQVRVANSPEKNANLIRQAIVQMLRMQGSHGNLQQARLVEMLGKLADQIAGAPGLSLSTKNQLLTQIGHVLSDLKQGGPVQVVGGANPVIRGEFRTLQDEIRHDLSGHSPVTLAIANETFRVSGAAEVG